MTQHRIMLLGASGQIGQALRSLSNQKGLPPNWELTCLARPDFNITDPAAIRSSIQTLKPDLIINASALANVQKAEQNKDITMANNFHAVAQIAAQCSSLDIPLIHLSTDFVFDGRKEAPYLPDDQMNPINHYGATEMMGEEAIRYDLAWHVILRVSSVFSVFGNNILTMALDMIEKQEELRIATDIMSAPTDALDIARAIITIGSELLAGKSDGYGTFHLSGAPAASHFDFVEAVMKAYESYTTRRPKLTATVYAEFDDAVRWPAYSVLDCKKIGRIYGIDQKPWQEGIDQALKALSNAGSYA